MAKQKKTIFWDDDIQIDYTGLEDIENDIKDYALDIMETIAKHPAGLTQSEIRKICTGKTQLMHQALKSLREADKLVKEGSGVKADPYIFKVKI